MTNNDIIGGVGVEVEVMLKEFLKSSLDIGKRLEL
jgi:hypothetical protein